MTESPLLNKRIVVTRQREQAVDFAEKLVQLGAHPVLIPTIEVVPPDDLEPLRQALQDLIIYDWLVLTSANAVVAVHDIIKTDSIDLKPLTDGPVQAACVGTATRAALKQLYDGDILSPEEFTAEALYRALWKSERRNLEGIRVLLPQANIARPVLYNLLVGEGAVVDAIEAYQTVPAKPDLSVLDTPLDAVTFTSGSTARNFAAMFNDPLVVLAGAKIVCIGPSTADVITDELEWNVDAVAEPHTIDGIIQCLIRIFGTD